MAKGIPSRGELPPELAESYLRHVDELIEEDGWDRPSTLWGLSWVTEDPAVVATVDQHAAALRDELEAGTGEISASVLGTSLLKVLGGHPFDGLIGYTAPAEVDAVVLSTEGWDYPTEVKQSGVEPDVPPSQYPGHLEVRILLLADRSGSLYGLNHVRGGTVTFVSDGDFLGRVPDALRRVVGLSTPEEDARPVSLLARGWLERVAQLPSGATWADAVATDPTVAFAEMMVRDVAEMLESTGDAGAYSAGEARAEAETRGGRRPDEEGPGFEVERAVLNAMQSSLQELKEGTVTSDLGEILDMMADKLGVSVTWETIREMRKADANDPDELSLLSWADSSMVARIALGNTVPCSDSLRAIEIAHGKGLAEKLAECIERRGWSDLEGRLFPVRVAKTGRNDPCPCGSGKKYKRCHGMPTPMVIDPLGKDHR